MRSIGLDVHQSFCQVAIHADGQTRAAGRVATDREELELFARSLDPTDQVVLEASGPAFEIARIRGERAYRRLAADWSASGPPKEKDGRRRDTGARILKSPVRGQAARRAQAPRPAL